MDHDQAVHAAGGGRLAGDRGAGHCGYQRVGVSGGPAGGVWTPNQGPDL